MRIRGIDGADWVAVRLFSRRWEAEMIQGFLESHGVPTWLAADDAGGSAYPNVSLTGYPVMVREDDAETAAGLLETGVGGN